MKSFMRQGLKKKRKKFIKKLGTLRITHLSLHPANKSGSSLSQGFFGGF